MHRFFHIDCLVSSRPVLLGLLSFILLRKKAHDASADFQPIVSSPNWWANTSAWNGKTIHLWVHCYLHWVHQNLAHVCPFSYLEDNVNFVTKAPIHKLHTDLDCKPQQLDSVIAAINCAFTVLSLSLISGWGLAVLINLAQEAIGALGCHRIIIATSSDLLFSIPPSVSQLRNIWTPDLRTPFPLLSKRATRLLPSCDLKILRSARHLRLTTSQLPSNMNMSLLQVQSISVLLLSLPRTSNAKAPSGLLWGSKGACPSSQLQSGCSLKLRRIIKPMPSSVRARSPRFSTRNLELLFSVSYPPSTSCRMCLNTLSLCKEGWDAYLTWAVDSFHLTTAHEKMRLSLLLLRL